MKASNQFRMSFFSLPLPSCLSCVYDCDLTQENVHYSHLLTGKTDY